MGERGGLERIGAGVGPGTDQRGLPMKTAEDVAEMLRRLQAMRVGPQADRPRYLGCSHHRRISTQAAWWCSGAGASQGA